MRLVVMNMTKVTGESGQGLHRLRSLLNSGDGRWRRKGKDLLGEKEVKIDEGGYTK